MTRLEACLLLNAIPGIGLQRSLKLTQYFGSPEAIFNASFQDWIRVEGIGDFVCQALKQWKEHVKSIQKQLQLLNECKITPICFGTSDYPYPLLFVQMLRIGE